MYNNTTHLIYTQSLDYQHKEERLTVKECVAPGIIDYNKLSQLILSGGARSLERHAVQ